MFDLSRVTETIGGLLGQGAEGLGQDALLEKLSDLGIDPAQLEGLDMQGISQLLEENGIDLGQFDPQQLTELTSQFGEGNGLASLLEFFGKDGK